MEFIYAAENFIDIRLVGLNIQTLSAKLVLKKNCCNCDLTNRL